MSPRLVDAFRAGRFAFVAMLRTVAKWRSASAALVPYLCATFPPMGKQRQRERDLIFEAQEVEAISLECQECRARVEVPAGGGLQTGALACPCCGERIPHRAMVGAFLRMIEEAQTVRGVRFRVRLLRDLP